MTKVFAHQQGKEKFVGWHASVPALIKPKIVEQFADLDGETLYRDVDGKTYVPALFDKYFKQDKIIGQAVEP